MFNNFNFFGCLPHTDLKQFDVNLMNNISISNFFISVPPRDVIIMDEYGQRIEETVGPIDEGSNVTLICEAEGGD